MQYSENFKYVRQRTSQTVGSRTFLAIKNEQNIRMKPFVAGNSITPKLPHPSSRGDSNRIFKASCFQILMKKESQTKQKLSCTETII